MPPIVYTFLINTISAIILGILKNKSIRHDEIDKEVIDNNHSSRNTLYKLLKLKRSLENKIK